MAKSGPKLGSELPEIAGVIKDIESLRAKLKHLVSSGRLNTRQVGQINNFLRSLARNAKKVRTIAFQQVIKVRDTRQAEKGAEPAESHEFRAAHLTMDGRFVLGFLMGCVRNEQPGMTVAQLMRSLKRRCPSAANVTEERVRDIVDDHLANGLIQRSALKSRGGKRVGNHFEITQKGIEMFWFST